MPIDSNDKYIWFVRHAESIQNIEPMITNISNKDIPLTDAGRDHAHQFANISSNIADKIFVSPYKRAISTAAPFITNHYIGGKTPETIVDDNLREFQPYNSDLRDAICYLSDAAKRYCYQNHIKKYWEDLNPYKCDGCGSETYSQFVARVVTFLSSILNRNVKGNIVVFSHYHVITLIDNLFQGNIDIDNLDTDNIFDLAGSCERIDRDPDILKELMINTEYDSDSPIQNCTALYIRLRPYDDNSPLYRVIEYGYRDRVDVNGTMGEDILAE